MGDPNMAGGMPLVDDAGLVGGVDGVENEVCAEYTGWENGAIGAVDGSLSATASAVDPGLAIFADKGKLAVALDPELRASERVGKRGPIRRWTGMTRR